MESEWSSNEIRGKNQSEDGALWNSEAADSGMLELSPEED